MTMIVAAAALLFALLGVAPALAQIQPSAATLFLVEGAVYLDDQLVTTSPAAAGLGESATIRTARGRAVVALKRGGLLTLDDHTVVRVHANRVYNFNRIEVLEGTAVVMTETSAPLVSCRSDARLSSGGVFRFDVQERRPDAGRACRFRVYDGAAAVPLVSVISAMRSGQGMDLDPACGDMIPTMTFAADKMDDFDRWSRDQAAARRR
jgi:hypothetical protein